MVEPVVKKECVRQFTLCYGKANPVARRFPKLLMNSLRSGRIEGEAAS